jgi:lipopolysaccharide export system protein LptA
MAIVQISKIQQRSGNIVDLPQLDEAEFGWATDAKRLFIGKVSPNENIEVLTSYSNIVFSQIDGAVGNLDISAVSVDDGQILAYDGTNWVNRGGAAGGLIDLGAVSDVSIGGGAIGYVLETDGLGNLAWTPKGTLYTNINSLTNDTGNANVITMNVANTTPYVNSQPITITGVQGSNTVPVNGITFYVKLDSNFTSNSSTTGSGNVTLYTDALLSTTANGFNLTANANTGIATAVVLTGGSGGTSAGGSNTSIQYNNSGVVAGDANLVYDFSGKILTLSGNANVGNLNASSSVVASTLTSNIATGTAPLTVTSTTRVSNLSVAYSNVSDFGVTTLQSTGTFFPTFVSASATGNRALGANANLGFNAATGNLSATILYANTTITAVGNIVGANLDTAGNVTASRLISNVATGTAPLTVTSTTRVANLNVAYANVADLINVADVTTGTFYPMLANAATGNVSEGSNANLTFNAATGALNSTLLGGTLTTAAQPNVTSLGTLTSLTVSGTLTANDIATFGTTGDALNITGAGNTNVNGAGGIVNIAAAQGNGTGQGGNLTLIGGAANSAGNAAGGIATLTAGAGYGQGQGGTVGIYSGVSANTYGAKGGNIVITGGTYDGAGGDMTISGGEAAGLNHIGGDINIVAGASTGNATPGRIVIQTATAGSTGNTVQTLSDRVIIDDTHMNVRFTTASSSTTTGALEVAGGVGVGGNVYAAAFYGAATGLTSVPAGNISGTVANATHASTANTVVDAAQGNITSVGTLTGLSVASGAITATTPILITQTWNNSSVAFTGIRENITNTASAAGSYLLDLQVGGTSQFVVGTDGNINVGPSNAGGITATSIQVTTLTTGANITAGTVTGNWTLSAGSRLNATYADLAEYYEADQVYGPGTVLEFGGEKEVTLAQDGTTRVAGVVSTDPAYAMNTKCPGIAIAIALQGRVPTKVRGSVRKGDMMVSAGNGYARPWNNPQMGTVIGKALENFDGIEGVIEVAIGRL